MKKYFKIIFIPLILFVLFSIACASAPPVEEPEPVAQPETPAPAPTPDPAPAPAPAVEVVDTSGLEILINRVQEARQRAVDFEVPAYFPSDWEDAEAQYKDAEDMPRSTNDEVREATASYAAVADKYDELFNKTIPLYAQALEDEIMAVRSELISTGFRRELPDYFDKADKLAITALEQYEDEDYYTARDTAYQALDEYTSFLLAARTYLVRQEILDRGFADYDGENFDRTDDIGWDAIDKYEEGDHKAARELAEEARSRYNLLLSNGWITYASERKKSAGDERERAIFNKANIAVRERFREADVIFNNAENNFDAKNYETAAILYIESEAVFAVSIDETLEKRRIAEEAIRLAEEKIEVSVETALEAERIIEEGGIR